MVDSSDTLRLEDCRRELHKLLGEERLAGASLLIFANKQDLPGAYTEKQVEEALQLGRRRTRTRRRRSIRAPSWVARMVEESFAASGRT